MTRVKYLVLLVLLFATNTFGQNNSKEIMSREAAELVAVLGKADAPIFEKAKACQRLGIIGSTNAVPALAELLADERLNLYARTGLEGIPGPEVDAAFRDAAKKLQGRPLVGVLNSIGQRGDDQAIDLLGEKLNHSIIYWSPRLGSKPPARLPAGPIWPSRARSPRGQSMP